jgi:hypothetical protein
MNEKRCPIDLKPMADWVVEEDPQGICRECLLAPPLQWYRDELESRGLISLAKGLEDIAREAETFPLKLCQEFDRIKGAVEEPLRERLLDFDCAVQTWQPDDD